MYETEIKIEISDAQRESLLQAFALEGFADKGVVEQIDYYTKAVQSPHGNSEAYDIERYRSEGGKFFYTTKEWEPVENGNTIRKEYEHGITSEDYQAAITQTPNLMIIKKRHSFMASFEGREISLSIDSVKFDHSPVVRHFMEPEILVSDKTQVSETREFLRRFAAGLLGYEASEIVEAPGMFAMAFKKL